MCNAGDLDRLICLVFLPKRDRMLRPRRPTERRRAMLWELSTTETTQTAQREMLNSRSVWFLKQKRASLLTAVLNRRCPDVFHRRSLILISILITMICVQSKRDVLSLGYDARLEKSSKPDQVASGVPAKQKCCSCCHSPRCLICVEAKASQWLTGRL